MLGCFIYRLYCILYNFWVGLVGLKIVTLDCAMSIEMAVKIYEVVGHMLDGTTRQKRQKKIET